MTEHIQQQNQPLVWEDLDYHAMPDALKPHLDYLYDMHNVARPVQPDLAPISEMSVETSDNPVDAVKEINHTAPATGDSTEADTTFDPWIELPEQIEAREFRAEAMKAIKEGSLDSAVLNQYVRGMQTLTGDEAMAVFRKTGNYVRFGYDADLRVISKANPKDLAAVYGTGLGFSSLQNMISLSLDIKNMPPHGAANVLATVHGVDNLMQLRSKDGSPNEDKILQKLLDHPYFYQMAAESLAKGVDDTPTARRDAQTEIMKNMIDIPDLLATQIEWASYSRINHQDKKGLTSPRAKWASFLANIAEVRDAIGVDGMMKLHEEARIINFDYYTGEQGQRLLKVLVGDEQTIEHFKAGDTTVVFTTPWGDHNGAMQSTSYLFEGKRSLFFEIQEPGDFKKHLEMLKAHGIRPSTVVMAAHGEPGNMAFGDGTEGFTLTNDSSKVGPNTPNNILVDNALHGIAHEYMRPSRGIDDDDAAIGRMRIILKSCSQDKPNAVTNLSTAESLTYALAHPNVDVYAGSEVTTMHPTENGLGLRLMTNFGNDDLDYQGLNISHLRLGPDNRLIKTKKEELNLRKAAT